LPEMKARVFDTQSDLDDHVKAFNYKNDALCFAIAWEEFDLD
jgi:hypothetical protein